MRDVTSANFGLLIAFVIPGFILLWGIAPYAETVQAWIEPAKTENAIVGGFLYVTVASTGLGHFVSTVRWLLIDSIHHISGVDRPEWNFRRLQESVAAFDQLIEIHYRYYQAHANTLVAITAAAILRWSAFGFRWDQLLLVISSGVVLFLGSRDTLSKYYRRVEELLYRR